MAENDAVAEIEAMSAVAKALQGLDQPALKRVLGWAADHFGVRQTTKPERSGGADSSGGDNSVGLAEGVNEDTYETFGDLFAAADPKTGQEKALVAAFWLQVHEGESGLKAQAMNELLKHMGHGLSNVTREADRLKSQRPQLLIQLKKTGKSKQARKLYKVTSEGIQFVRNMLAGVPE